MGSGDASDNMRGSWKLHVASPDSWWFKFSSKICCFFIRWQKWAWQRSSTLQRRVHTTDTDCKHVLWSVQWHGSRSWIRKVLQAKISSRVWLDVRAFAVTTTKTSRKEFTVSSAKPRLDVACASTRRCATKRLESKTELLLLSPSKRSTCKYFVLRVLSLNVTGGSVIAWNSFSLQKIWRAVGAHHFSGGSTALSKARPRSTSRQRERLRLRYNFMSHPLIAINYVS